MKKKIKYCWCGTFFSAVNVEVVTIASLQFSVPFFVFIFFLFAFSAETKWSNWKLFHRMFMHSNRNEQKNKRTTTKQNKKYNVKMNNGKGTRQHNRQWNSIHCTRKCNKIFWNSMRFSMTSPNKNPLNIVELSLLPYSIFNLLQCI